MSRASTLVTGQAGQDTSYIPLPLPLPLSHPLPTRRHMQFEIQKPTRACYSNGVYIWGTARIICRVAWGRWRPALMEVSKVRQRHAQFGRKQTVELNNDRAEVSDISSRMLSWKQKHKQDNLERHSEHLLPWLKYIKQKHNPSQAEKCMHQSRRGTKPVWCRVGGCYTRT